SVDLSRSPVQHPQLIETPRLFQQLQALQQMNGTAAPPMMQAMHSGVKDPQAAAQPMTSALTKPTHAPVMSVQLTALGFLDRGAFGDGGALGIWGRNGLTLVSRRPSATSCGMAESTLSLPLNAEKGTR